MTAQPDHLPSINWFNVFEAVCERGGSALEWGMPEPWVQVELYTELKSRCSDTRWMPFPNEIPYITRYPVRLPRSDNRDWRTEGAVKWVDLCLRSAAGDAWYWVELKVRHASKSEREQQDSDSALDAYRKDVVALMGLDAERTGQTWTQPDRHTVVYWMDSLLRPHAATLSTRRHIFCAALLHLGGTIGAGYWSEATLQAKIDDWFRYRSRHSSTEAPPPELSVTQREFGGGHTLVLCEWEYTHGPSSSNVS